MAINETELANARGNEHDEGNPQIRQDESDTPNESRSPIFEDRIEKANELRTQGNDEFKSGHMEDAVITYRRALYHVEFDEVSFEFELMEKHREMVKETRLPILLNISACLLKLEEKEHASDIILYCTEAIKIQPDNTKALYRRGLAQLHRGFLEKARSDLLQALDKTPNDSSVKKALHECEIKLRQARKRDKQKWKGAFKLSNENNTTSPAQISSSPWSKLGSLSNAKRTFLGSFAIFVVLLGVSISIGGYICDMLSHKAKN